MTESPSDEAAAEPSPLEEFAATVASTVGAARHDVVFDTVKVYVDPSAWIETLRTAKHDLGLVHFSYLSAIDWANDVAVGDPPAEPVEERFEVLAAVADLTDGRLVHFSTSLSKDEPALPTATSVYAGAAWHEREAHEMFDIDFAGHPHLEKLYLPSDFEGHPLKKSYPLLTREVKPWPGTVDVEGMPDEGDEASDEGSDDAAVTTPAGATTENPGR